MIIQKQFFLHPLFDLIKKFNKSKNGLLSDLKVKSFIIGRQLFHHLLAKLGKKLRNKLVYSDIRLKSLIIQRQFFLHPLFDLIKKFNK